MFRTSRPRLYFSHDGKSWWNHSKLSAPNRAEINHIIIPLERNNNDYNNNNDNDNYNDNYNYNDNDNDNDNDHDHDDDDDDDNNKSATKIYSHNGDMMIEDK